MVHAKKRKHPKFLRPNYGRSKRKRVKRRWRSQRGIDNKKRLKLKYMGASPSIGYGQPKEIRGLHPKGLPEILVQSPDELKGMKNVVVRIAKGVGRLKRQAIEKLALSLGLHVAYSKKYAEKPKEEKGKGKKQAPEEKKAEAQAENKEKAKEEEGGKEAPQQEAKDEKASEGKAE